ncbi:MAG TPA: DUF202 domain-containing protein [Synechococcales cyanobacterium M55_K2018_004]|nr:DUF202 domain-containing protein [Synechococcales cyanobacterium M55_K2018_004]
MKDASPEKPNPNVELAKERNRAAAERTLMAWIRTCLALITFGFGIDRIVEAIRQLYGSPVRTIHLSRTLGLAFIGLGVLAMLGAVLDHRQELRRIQRQQDYIYHPRRSLGLMVAIALVILGCFAFIGILIQAIAR